MEHIIGEDRAIQPSEKQVNSEHPLGPRLVLLRMRAGKARAIGAGLVGVGAALFAVAGSLTPPTTGFGAHEQLGLGPCSFPLGFGLPCPTCGMTTAFAYLAHGQPMASFHAQPAGFVIALCVGGAILMGAAFLITGRVWNINWYRVPPSRVAIIVASVLLAGWGYKILSTLTAG